MNITQKKLQWRCPLSIWTMSFQNVDLIDISDILPWWAYPWSSQVVGFLLPLLDGKCIWCWSWHGSARWTYKDIEFSQCIWRLMDIIQGKEDSLICWCHAWHLRRCSLCLLYLGKCFPLSNATFGPYYAAYESSLSMPWIDGFHYI